MQHTPEMIAAFAAVARENRNKARILAEDVFHECVISPMMDDAYCPCVVRERASEAAVAAVRARFT